MHCNNALTQQICNIVTMNTSAIVQLKIIVEIKRPACTPIEQNYIKKENGSALNSIKLPSLFDATSELPRLYFKRFFKYCI